jgi:hypothetical protein
MPLINSIFDHSPFIQIEPLIQLNLDFFDRTVPVADKLSGHKIWVKRSIFNEYSDAV